MDTDDMILVRQYADNQSDTAFSELASRHVNLVYSAALRQLGDPSLAEEVTQTVFVILARKAASLQEGTILSGWLYRTVRFASSAAIKREIRRQRREQEAHMQSTLNQSEDKASWEQLSPHLDEAMAQLRDQDRDAIVLRFFENKSMQEVAQALGVEERAAQKRVSRSLEKLRGIFARRGIALSAVMLAGVFSANAVQAAPAHLAASAAAAAGLKVGGAASSAVLVKTTLKLMAWAKLKLAVFLSASLIVTGMTVAVMDHVRNAGESIDAKIARLSRPGTTTKEAIRTLGEPQKYGNGLVVYDRASLPQRYSLIYTNGINVWTQRGKISQLQSLSPGPGFSYHGKLRLGSTIDQVLLEIGPPSETITNQLSSVILGQTLSGDPGALYQDLNGEKGYCYYWRPDQNVRFIFKRAKVIALLIDVAN